MKYFFEPPTKHRALTAYKDVVSHRELELIRATAETLKGCTVVHINTTAESGGVAEMLKSQVVLERSMGIDSRWLVMKAPEAFFEVTKKMHNLLQGKRDHLSETEKGYYLYTLHERAPELLGYVSKYKKVVLVIHDPQPLPFIAYIKDIPTVVRLHMDLSTPDETTLEFFRPFLDRVDRVVVSDPTFRPKWLSRSKTLVSYPAIDPLAEKNIPISDAVAHKVLRALKIDPTRPLMTQISRFDPWKDPLGVIGAYRIAKKSVPDLQLAMGGLIVAADDPEAKRLYEQVRRKAKGDPDIHLFGRKKPPGGISNDLFVNTLQSRSLVVVQKSTREGFGMSLTEAMWKRAAVVVGTARGLRRQVRNGVTGFVVDSDQQCAARVVELINNPALCTRLGAAAHISAKEQFLIPRLIGEFLELYSNVVSPQDLSGSGHVLSPHKRKTPSRSWVGKI